MPLSDHEQRILDEIERRLAAEDPKFARSTAVATPRGVALRRVKRAIGAFVVGLVLLVVALTIGLGTRALVLPLGVVAFLIMLGSVNIIARASKEIGRSPKDEKQSWFARQEERWRRRFERGEDR